MFNIASKILRACKNLDELRDSWNMQINGWINDLSFSECQYLIWIKDEIKFRFSRNKTGLSQNIKKNREKTRAPKRCFSCGSKQFWRTVGNEIWICNRCHPPALEKNMEFLETE